MSKFIVAPNIFKKDIIDFYRKNDPFFDVVVIDKNELADAIYPKVKLKAISRFIKEFGISYKTSLKYCSFIRYLDDNNKDCVLELLPFYKLAIKDDLFYFDNYAKDIFKNQQMDVIGYYENDYFLQNIFKKLQIKVNFIKINTNIKENFIKIYETIENEIHFLFVDILDLLRKNVDINNIYIYGYRSDYNFYLKYYSTLYDLKINNLESDTFLNLDFVKKFLNDFKKGISLEEYFNDLDGLGIDSDILINFKNLINLNHDENLSLAQQLDVFKNILNVPYKNDLYDNGLTIIKEPIKVQGKHIFCIGFDQNNYPKIKSDDDIIFDIEKEKIGLLTSQVESSLNKQALLEFLSSDNTFYYSFAKKNYSNNFYLSFLANTFNFKKLRCDVLDHDYNYIASLLSANKLEDAFYSVNKTSPFLKSYRELNYSYKNYDNSFKTFKVYDENSSLYYSYSSLKEYAECPFKYYVDKILKIKEDKNIPSATIGSFVHKVYEIAFKNGVDFETAFKRAIESNDYTIDAKTKFLINGNKKRIKDVYDFNINHLKQIKNYSLLLENRFSTTLKNPNSTFNGIIDKTVIIDNKYYVVIDYKTNSESLNEKLFQYGLGLQLPAYTFLLKQSKKNSKDLSNLELGGVYYQNIFDDIKSNDKKLFKLHGVSLQSDDFYNKFFVYDYVYNKENCKDEEGLDQYADIAKTSYDDIDSKIRDNDFKISPLKEKNLCDGCKYCDYKDICFLKADNMDINQKDN